MNTIHEAFLAVLKKIDEDPGAIVDQYSIKEQLQAAIPADATLSTEELAEIIAFTLVDQFKGSDEDFGSYFKPPIAWVDNEGKRHTSPPLDAITADMLTYWEKRGSEVTHPFLMARYNGLVWDLSQFVSGQAASPALRKKFIAVSLEIIEKRLYKDSLTGSFLLERTLEIVSKFNDKEFFAPIKKLVSELQQEFDAEGKVRYCVFAFDLFTAYKKLEASEEEIAERVVKMEGCLITLCTPNTDGKTDPWSAEEIAGRLANYYLKRGKKEDVKRVVLMVGGAYEPIFNGASNFQVAGWLQSIFKIYRHYQLNAEAEAISLRLQEVSAKSGAEMGVIEHSFDIPKEEVTKLVDYTFIGGEDEIYTKITGNFIPDKAHLKTSLLEFAKESPLQFMMGTQLQDRKGRAIANIGSLESDLEGQLVLRISEKFKLDGIFLHYVLEGGIKKEFLTSSSIASFLSKSAIIDKNRLPIFQRALESYFNGDYLVFIHLVIPQFEEAIRNMIELNGGNIQKFKDGVFNLRTFDDILRDPIVESVVGDDIQTYFRILFTDARGWNLRNEVCHGMVQYELFDKQTADRVLHAVLCLGMIRPTSS